MIALIAVLRIAANISSAMASSEFWMMSKVTASLIGCISVPSSLLDMDIAIGVDGDSLAGMDDHGCCGVFDNGGAGKTHVGLELFGVVDIGFMLALRRIIDETPPFARSLEQSAGLGRWR